MSKTYFTEYEPLFLHERTIKRLTVSLTERGIIVRRNGRRNGFWEVL
ncbi:MAG: hypothetical protein IKU64_05665 [Bacteroides sp.]|nr:hypothetical protein [Bacteroides sp.]